MNVGRKPITQRGAITVLAVPLILVILLISVIVLTVGNYVRQKSRAQTALDLSLIASSRELCISSPCWTHSRISAVRSLEENLPFLDLSFVNLDDLDANGEAITRWEKDGVVLSLERGRWIQDVGFEPLEGNWQGSYPGVPREVVTFAVRISLSFPVRSILPGVIPGMLTAKVEGISTANLATDAWVSPFLAIPACAFHQAAKVDICSSDRFFAGTDEFRSVDLTSGEPVLTLPHTDYTLMDSFHFQNNGQYLRELFDGKRVSITDDSIKSCFNPTPWLRDRFDNVGVLGALGSFDVTESLIQSLATGGVLVKARIGDTFSLLPGRATDSLTARVIWSEITNAALNGSYDSSHRPMREITDRPGIMRNNNLMVSDINTQQSCKNKWLHNPEQLRMPSEFLLSSFRSSFGFKDDFQERFNRNGGCHYDDSNFDLPYLSVLIPMIALDEAEQLDCNGANQWLDPSKKYKVVGFVPINIFDIGKRIRDISDLQYNDAAVAQCVNISSDSGILNQLPNTLNPFYTSAPADGYVIRARVNCGLKVTGSGTGGVDINRPVLTE